MAIGAGRIPTCGTDPSHKWERCVPLVGTPFPASRNSG